MKKFCATIAMAFAVSAALAIPMQASAKGSSHVPSTQGTMPFISKDTAIGFAITERFAVSTDGILLVCSNDADWNSAAGRCLINGVNSWKTPENSVPVGRTYVGFQLVKASIGYQLIVYWK